MSQLLIGWGRREISTSDPVSIPGQHYIRVSEGIHDPLYATALCLDGGEGQDAVIFCSLDMTSPRTIWELIIERVAQKYPDVPTDIITINVTHTHTSAAPFHQPETSQDGKTIYPAEQWADFAAGQAADAIHEAWTGRKEGGVAYGYGYAVVAHSRRTVYSVDQSLGAEPGMNSDGFAVMYGKTNKPDFAGYEAGADHFVNLLYTFDTQNKLTGMVVNVPGPSQTAEHWRMLSADYWNEVREGVAAEYGPDVYVLPQCAAAGDLSPRILHYLPAQQRRMKLKYGLDYDSSRVSRHEEDFYKKSMAERRDIAERILAAVREVYAWASKEIYSDVPVVHRAEVIRLPYRRITDEEKAECERNIASAKLVIPEGATPQEAAKLTDLYNTRLARNRRVIERWKNFNPDDRFPMLSHIVRVGDVAFASNGFEYYMDYMHRIQARSPFVQTFIIQLSSGSGYGGYLPTARAAANRGYGSSMYENTIGPEGGQVIVEETLRVLNEIR